MRDRRVKAFVPAFEYQINVEAGAVFRTPFAQIFLSPPAQPIAHHRGARLPWESETATKLSQLRRAQIHQ